MITLNADFLDPGLIVHFLVDWLGVLLKSASPQQETSDVAPWKMKALLCGQCF